MKKKTDYIEQLKSIVADAFKDAEDKSQLDALVSINAAIKNVEDERTALMDKQRDLVSAYKDALMNPGVADKPEPEPTTLEKKVRLDPADFVLKSLKEIK